MSCITSQNGNPFKEEKKMDLNKGRYKIRNIALMRAGSVLSKIKGHMTTI